MVGIPWLERGRSRAGVDCWGTAWLAYRDLLGVTLPSLADAYDTIEDREAIRRMIDEHRGDWIPVEPSDVVQFDLAMFRKGGEERHVGLVVRRGWMLHIEIGGMTKIERYNTGRHMHALLGFYRLGDAT